MLLNIPGGSIGIVRRGGIVLPILYTKVDYNDVLILYY